jgi:hypothetical protein
MDDQHDLPNKRKDEVDPYNGTYISMEEATLASLGLDPDKATKLDDNYANYRRDRPNAF